MKRTVAVLALSVLVLAGCAAPGPPARVSTDSAPPAKVATTSADTREPTATLRATHGDELVRGSFQFGYKGADAVFLAVMLRSAEPTGTQPFADLALMASLYPGRARYQVTYDAPQSHVVYTWSSQGKQVQVYRKQGRMASRPSAYASGVDTAALQAIAAGRESAPWLPTR